MDRLIKKRRSMTDPAWLRNYFGLLPCLAVTMIATTTRTVAAAQEYFSTSNSKHIGWENPLAAVGNPLKGLLGSPSFHDFDASVTSIDSSLEIHYVGLNDLMFGDPDVIGYDNAFKWDYLENALTTSASRHRHSVLTFNLHYPTKESNIPQYLLDAGIKVHNVTSALEVNGVSPDYGDPILLNALRQFIAALGERYDGDTRIAFIHLGLLGFWGEWHTYGFDNWVPEHAKQSVTEWYAGAFQVTKLQARYPYQPAYDAGIGLYDGSFAYHTLDGDANGGHFHPEWYFWPLVEQAGDGDFWRFAPMGGETRPELQNNIFEPGYAAGTYEKQDFIRCTYTTHASYVFHHDAFKNGGYAGAELEKAKEAHARLGYNFIVSRVAAVKRDDGSNTIDIVVDLRQIGVAPFYYDLDLALDCDEISSPLVLKGGELLVADMDTSTFTFEKVPATSLCLQSVSLHLQSSYAFPERPIKFAQGHDGKVALAIPMPDGAQPRPEEAGTWGAVSGFVVAKVTGRSYETIGQLKDWDELDLADYGDEQWTIQANITGAHSATFRFDGQAHSVSHTSFTLSGDVMGYSRPISYLTTPGWKKVTVSAFDYDGGIIGHASVEFTVINSSTRAPSATPAPIPAPTHSQVSSAGSAENDNPPESSHSGQSHDDLAEPKNSDKDTISSDEPHGFNTPKAPTVLEMNNDEKATKRRSRQKLATIVVWTILPVMFLASLIILIRWLINRSRPQDSVILDEVDKAVDMEDPLSATSSEDDELDRGDTSPPSVMT